MKSSGNVGLYLLPPEEDFRGSRTQYVVLMMKWRIGMRTQMLSEYLLYHFPGMVLWYYRMVARIQAWMLRSRWRNLWIRLGLAQDPSIT